MFDKMPKTKKTQFLYPKFVERGNRNRTSMRSVSLNGMNPNPNSNLKPKPNPEPQNHLASG